MGERTGGRPKNSDSALMGELAREMRCPIHAIISYADMSLGELTFGPDAASITKIGEHQAVIKQEAFALLVQVNQVLEWTRIRARRPKLRITTVALDAVLDFTKDTVRPLADKNRTSVEMTLEGPSTAELDRERFEQILMNLAVNACAFTQDGTVRLLVRNSPSRLLLQVTDTGVGIDPDRHDEVFEPYADFAVAGDGTRSGAGLGLAIVKEACECLGGAVSVESEAGQGASFTVVIPLPIQALSAPAGGSAEL